MTAVQPLLLCAGLLLGWLLPGQVAGQSSVADPVPRQGAQVYDVDSAASELKILVYRAGPLAKLGHNHVIVASELTGEVYRQEPITGSGFELYLAPETLQVDPVEARQAEGSAFESQPTASDIQGTRRNMLGKRVLDSSRFPQIKIQGFSLTGELPAVVLNCRVLLRDLG